MIPSAAVSEYSNICTPNGTPWRTWSSAGQVWLVCVVELAAAFKSTLILYSKNGSDNATENTPVYVCCARVAAESHLPIRCMNTMNPTYRLRVTVRLYHSAQDTSSVKSIGVHMNGHAMCTRLMSNAVDMKSHDSTGRSPAHQLQSLEHTNSPHSPP